MGICGCKDGGTKEETQETIAIKSSQREERVNLINLIYFFYFF